jgi:hypothetical protein
MPNPNCERCHGTGLVTIHGGGSGDPEWDADDQPCTSCDDYETPEAELEAATLRYQSKKWVLLNPNDEHSPRWKRDPEDEQ